MGALFTLTFLTLHADGEQGSVDYDALRASLRQSSILSVESLLANEWIEKGGLEVLTAGPSAKMNHSRFGHVALRFVGSAQHPMEDLVFEPVAIINPNHSTWTTYKKGLMGDYPVAMVSGQLGELIVRYYHLESRGYSRTILPSTPALRRSLLEQLLQSYTERWDKDHYLFLANNCANYLASVLAHSGFHQIDMPSPFIPTTFSQHLRRSFLAPWPDLMGLSQKDLASLQRSGNKLNRLSRWKTIDLQRYLVFVKEPSPQEYAALYGELLKRKDFAATEAVYGFLPAPGWMYERQILQMGLSVKFNLFDRSQWQFQALQNNAVIHSTYSVSFCQIRTEQCDYFKNAHNVVNFSQSFSQSL